MTVLLLCFSMQSLQQQFTHVMHQMLVKCWAAHINTEEYQLESVMYYWQQLHLYGYPYGRVSPNSHQPVLAAYSLRCQNKHLRCVQIAQHDIHNKSISIVQQIQVHAGKT